MEKFSFFNSVNGDRKYNANHWAEFFYWLVTDGYFANDINNLLVTASGTNMNITVKAGAAWIKGRIYHNTKDLTLTLQPAEAILPRIDRIVIRCDFAKREIKAQIKQGTPASSPVAKPLQRDADAHELGIADIYVAKGVTSITQAQITDLRINKEMCGAVNSIIQADTTTIFHQFQSWYAQTTKNGEADLATWFAQQQQSVITWFINLKNTINENSEINLSNKIDALDAKMKTIESNTSKMISAAKTETQTMVNNAKADFDSRERRTYSERVITTDANEVDTVVETYRRGTIKTRYARAALSGGTSPYYTTRTITFYAEDGTTVNGTELFKMLYNQEKFIGVE